MNQDQHCACHARPKLTDSHDGPWFKKYQSWLILALACVLALMCEILSLYEPVIGKWPSLLLSLVVICLAGAKIYWQGWVVLWSRQLNMNALMTIAVTGSVLLGSWPEAAMVMVLFTLAEAIEVLSLNRARRAVAELIESVPKEATVRSQDGSWQLILVDDIRLDDVIRVRPGEKLAVDGVVTLGCPSINQAAITGESLPVDKKIQDTVFAGTLNLSDEFEMRATSLTSQSLLARITSAVATAQSQQAPTERFIDRFARIYTPVVFFLALIVAILPPVFFDGSWHDWIYRALVLLVIACPCALVISTPISIVSGLTRAARQGILIKGGVYLEQGRSLRTLALDKTGTITKGKPIVMMVSEVHGECAHNVQLARALAMHSDHPISQAIARYGAEQAIKDEIDGLFDVKNFIALAGQGVQGDIGSDRYYLGNRSLMIDRGLWYEELAEQLLELGKQGYSTVILATEKIVLSIFAVADEVKSSSLQAITELHKLGIRTHILSGDTDVRVQAIARQVGVDHADGDLLPDGKLQIIERMIARSEKGLVAMVGDGINDAPALAKSHIGFAMGIAGSDTALETADVAIMDDDLRKIPVFIRLSNNVHVILWQNITLAVGVKVIFFAMTLIGTTTMWEAVFADMGVSLLVIANALRLLRK
jgi:Zn2+/Cd2+-exporting ATPase